jgi:hypothetical protein
LNASSSAEGSNIRKGNEALMLDEQFPQDLLPPWEPFHKIAGLSCDVYGGPPNEFAAEMVYWEDIPSDATYISPFKDSTTKYLTFEPDRAGWNNIRMGLETVIAMAHAMGRTLVLPPDREIWAMNKGSGGGEDAHNSQQAEQKKAFSFDEFYHLESLAVEHPGLDIITMEEFLVRLAFEQHAFTTIDPATETSKAFYPPGNRTKWDGQYLKPLFDYLRNPDVAYSEKWAPEECLAAFPASKDPKDLKALKDTLWQIQHSDNPGIVDEKHYIDAPTPVNGSQFDRMAEMIGRRKSLCVYDEQMQDALVVHFREDNKEGYRLLTHFYGFLFFGDWTHDLWSKRFVRDHVRYNDEIACAAGRVVHALRGLASQHTNDNNKNGKTNNNSLRASSNSNNNGQGENTNKGVFHTMHVRRNDFGSQYKSQVVDAQVIMENSKDELYEGATLFIATDEKDSSYFDPLREHYNVYLLKDFQHLLQDVNSNLYALIDQLVAARGETFHGVYLSTFTGYINRLRGYYSTKERLLGHELGILESYHFVQPRNKLAYRQYHPFRNPSFVREYPVAWRDIDQGIDELVHPHQHVTSASTATSNTAPASA